MTNFVWFRNDLRLTHNKVLQRVYDLELKVIPIFIIDPGILTQEDMNEKRLSFMAESLIDLDEHLKKYNSKLVVFKGEPYDVFQSLIQKTSKIKVFKSRDYTSFSVQRDESIRKLLQANTCAHEEIKNLVVIDQEDGILTQAQDPVKVFTQFKKHWLNKLGQQPHLLNFDYRIEDLFLSNVEIDSLNFPDDMLMRIDNLKSFVKNTSPFKGGATIAQDKWQEFVDLRLDNYKNSRDFLDRNGTSMLSPHYKWGTLSPHQAAKTCIEQLGPDFYEFKKHTGKGVETYLSELIWREFYKYINAYFPHSEKQNYNNKNINWQNNEEYLNAWCEGKTGYPIVDACMRCMNQVGWLHNRGRMIVGSFLCKDLLLDWRLGEKYFKQQLIDWDKTANNGGWQWVAGTGTDASPYFRIFNPTEQGKKFDPEGTFIKKFIPELANVPKEFIHEPSKLSLFEQDEYGCVLGRDYPYPIVDHKEARKKALEMYGGSKKF